MAKSRSKKKKHFGRRSKLNEKTLLEIMGVVRMGTSFIDASRFVGISEQTFYTWLKKGQLAIDAGKESIYREFLEGIRQAEVEAKVRRIGIIARHEDGDPKLALEMLARKYPEEFGRKDSIRQNIDLNVKRVSPQDELLEAHKEAERLGYGKNKRSNKKTSSK